MAPPQLLSSLLLLAGFAAAKTCTNLTIPIDISARQGVFKQIPVEDNLDVTAFAQEFTNIRHNYTKELLQGYQTLNGSYQISAKFCYPDSGLSTSTIQLLSHGIGFDKTYWDLSFNNYNYSYVETAIKHGYATLAIDRLGIGNSSHGDPFNVVQARNEVEALNAVTTKLRLGQIPEINYRFEKVIHVGHSFGSVQSYWLSSLYPDNTDGIVLTGWSANGTWFPTTVAAWNLHSARLNQPLRFGNQSNAHVLKAFKKFGAGNTLVTGVQALLKSQGINLSSEEIWNEIATTEVSNLINSYNETVVGLNYPPGYVTTSDLTADQYVFLLPGYFDPALGLLSEFTKQPVTIGEILTIGSSPPSSSFDGPVLVLTGEQDQPFCGGACSETGTNAASIPAEAAPLFPNASAFEAYIQPNSGHGINAHYNATGAYEVIQDFLEGHGLGS